MILQTIIRFQVGSRIYLKSCVKIGERRYLKAGIRIAFCSTTGLGFLADPRLRERCRHGQTGLVSNSRKKTREQGAYDIS